MGGNNPRRVFTEQKGKQQRIESEDERPESLASAGKAKDSRGQHLLMPAPGTEPSPHRRPGGGGGAATEREARRPRPAARGPPGARSPGDTARPPAPAPGERLCAILPRQPPRLPPVLLCLPTSLLASLHPSSPPSLPASLPVRRRRPALAGRAPPGRSLPADRDTFPRAEK